jgi:hypothetical protein
MPAALFTPTFLYMTAGLIVWALRFLAVYSFAGLACAGGWTDTGDALNPITIFVVASAGIGVGLCAAVALHALARVRTALVAETNDRGFVHMLAALVAGIAALAIVWETLPVFVVPVCV